MCFEHEMNKAFFKAYMFTGWIIQIQGVLSQKEHFPSKLICSDGLNNVRSSMFDRSKPKIDYQKMNTFESVG